jgi:hypothetical protein
MGLAVGGLVMGLIMLSFENSCQPRLNFLPVQG